MKENMQIAFNLNDFESISETSENQLVGGFSASLSFNLAMSYGDDNSNNCSAGNCVKGCGTGQNVDLCNTTPGCGVQ
ncbi:MAG: hypothetical protein Q8K92_06295 [Leadbetterella sp.]|nr:hypothetical protein [Leadbetterella sp.]